MANARLLFSFASLTLCLGLSTGCPRPDDVLDDPIEIGHQPTDPKLVALSGDLSAATLQPGQANEFFARVKIDASSMPGADRPPVNLALALDVSGSMQGEAMDAARASALDLLEALEDGDRFSLVTFGGKVELAFPAQVLDERSRQSALIAIERIEARGTTEMLGGLGLALSQAQAGHNPEGVNRVVLLSDGVPNQLQGVAELGDQAAASGITITSLGLGLEFDEQLLTQLSQRSGGRYHYIEESEEVREVFASELLQMRRVVARNLALTMQPGPGVEILGVLGHSPVSAGRGLQVSLGELADDESRELVLRLRTSPHREGARAELLDLTLGFEDVAAGAGYLTRDAFMSVSVGESVDEEAEAAALQVEIAGEHASAAAAILEVTAMAASGQYAPALSRLEAAESRARKAAERLDDDALRARVGDMKQLRESWEKAQPAVAIAVEVPGEGPRPKKDGKVQMLDSAGAAVPHEPSFAPPPPAQMRREHAKAVEALR
jgi:Ca-activated chloride channel family protein